MAAPNPVPKWSVDETIAFLGNIGLPHLGDAFRENAVSGSDLIDLSDADFKESLGCTPLQVKKIRRELEAWGIHSPAAVTEVAPNAPTPAAAAPPATTEIPVVAAAAAAAAPDPAVGGGGDRSVALQDEITKLQQRLTHVQGGAQSYSQAQQYLRRAEEQLRSAKSALTVTRVSGATETIQDVRIGAHGGGLLGPRRHQGRAMDRHNDFGHNMVEMGTVHKAKASVKGAAEQIQLAQKVLPNLPFIKPANVQSAMGGVMFNALLAPGLVGDMMQNAKVKQALAQVSEMHLEVTQAMDWCTNNMTAAQAEAAQINGTLMTKNSELAACR